MSYYIYCIGDGKHFKIGHSKNVNARLKALQNGNPNILHIFFKYRPALSTFNKIIRNVLTNLY